MSVYLLATFCRDLAAKNFRCLATLTNMAAHQQPPFRSAKNKSTATDSKAAKETDVWLDMRITENDWDRLGELIKPEVFIYLVTIRYKIFDQLIVGKENDHRNNGKLKKASKKVVKVIYIVGESGTFTDRDFVQDIGLIKCLSLMYEIPNPYLFNPALDGFEIPLQRVWDFYRGGPVKPKSHGTKELKAKAYKTLKMEKDLCAHKTFKDAEKRLIATFKLLKAIEESDSRKKDNTTEKFIKKEKVETTEGSYVGLQLESKAAEVPDARKNVMTTVESDSGNRAKAMENCDAKIELKASKGSEHRQNANAAMESDYKKTAKAREMSNCARQELKATERESRSGKEEKMYDSEAAKGIDDQEEEASSRPDSKNVRTCMTCGLQEPASKVFKKCRRCKVEGYPDPPYYCGRDCQVLDWTARHRQEHEKNYAGDSDAS